MGKFMDVHNGFFGVTAEQLRGCAQPRPGDPGRRERRLRAGLARSGGGQGLLPRDRAVEGGRDAHPRARRPPDARGLRDHGGGLTMNAPSFTATAARRRSRWRVAASLGLRSRRGQRDRGGRPGGRRRRSARRRSSTTTSARPSPTATASSTSARSSPASARWASTSSSCRSGRASRRIDPLRPEVLVYAPKRNGGWKLVAVEYVTLRSRSGRAPSGRPRRPCSARTCCSGAGNRYGLPRLLRAACLDLAGQPARAVRRLEPEHHLPREGDNGG